MIWAYKLEHISITCIKIIEKIFGSLIIIIKCNIKVIPESRYLNVVQLCLRGIYGAIGRNMPFPIIPNLNQGTIYFFCYKSSRPVNFCGVWFLTVKELKKWNTYRFKSVSIKYNTSSLLNNRIAQVRSYLIIPQ